MPLLKAYREQDARRLKLSGHTMQFRQTLEGLSLYPYMADITCNAATAEAGWQLWYFNRPRRVLGIRIPWEVTPTAQPNSAAEASFMLKQRGADMAPSGAVLIPQQAFVFATNGAFIDDSAIMATPVTDSTVSTANFASYSDCLFPTPAVVSGAFYVAMAWNQPAFNAGQARGQALIGGGTDFQTGIITFSTFTFDTGATYNGGTIPLDYSTTLSHSTFFALLCDAG